MGFRPVFFVNEADFQIGAPAPQDGVTQQGELADTGVECRPQWRALGFGFGEAGLVTLREGLLHILSSGEAKSKLAAGNKIAFDKIPWA